MSPGALELSSKRLAESPLPHGGVVHVPRHRQAGITVRTEFLG